MKRSGTDPRKIKTVKNSLFKIYIPISHNRYRNMNMTLACQFSLYRDGNSFRSHRWDLALLPVHPEKPRRGSVALKINNFNVMICKRDKEKGQKKSPTKAHLTYSLAKNICACLLSKVVFVLIFVRQGKRMHACADDKINLVYVIIN